MVKSILLLALFSLTFAASGEAYSLDRVLKDSTTFVALDLNSTTVFCTARGYSSVQLKVSLPDLDQIAHFDHRVVGERLPCITGGACSPDHQPESLINDEKPVELVPVRVVLKQTLVIDRSAGTCTQTLLEEVHALIRGQSFYHQVSGQSEAMEFAKCEKLETLGS